MAEDARIFITTMKFVSVNDKGEEITSTFGFTIWDGDANHFFLAADKFWLNSAAEVFEVLRGHNALQVIANIDNYRVGFAEIAKMAGGFGINAFARPENAKVGDPPPSYEWVRVSEKPCCFADYPNPHLNVVNDREFDCDYDCVHVKQCRKQLQKGKRGGRRGGS